MYTINPSLRFNLFGIQTVKYKHRCEPVQGTFDQLAPSTAGFVDIALEYFAFWTPP